MKVFFVRFVKNAPFVVFISHWRSEKNKICSALGFCVYLLPDNIKRNNQ